MSLVAADEEKTVDRTSHSAKEPQQRSTAGKSIATIAIVAVFCFAVALASRLVHQRTVRAELDADARDSAQIPVSVIHAQPSSGQLSVRFPANIQANTETPIYARTNGYIKRWLVDIGAHVERGQLLAEIEAPELDQQLRRAEGTQGQIEANLELARVTAARYQDLLKKDGVSKQETDQAISTLHADEANLKAAMAAVNQLKEMQSFERVTAPFAGTITARSIDIGTLIAAGTESVLFRLADTSTLRVYANVPEANSKEITPGLRVDVETPALPGRTFSGKVVRTAGVIDPVSRTMLTEIHVSNPNLELLPGQFGTVTFHLRSSTPLLTIPSSALLFRAQGTQVALVTENSTVHLQSIQLGRDFGTSVEVISGLRASDQVIDNPSDAITEGEQVAVQPHQTSNPGL